MRKPCPCGSRKIYQKCCYRYISGKDIAPGVEELMRSRYSAFARRKAEYIVSTMKDEGSLFDDNPKNMFDGDQTIWVSLEVEKVIYPEHKKDYGEVVFKAFYRSSPLSKEIICMQEHSMFKKIDDKWYYIGIKK